jgi:hypothetical protein
MEHRIQIGDEALLASGQAFEFTIDAKGGAKMTPVKEVARGVLEVLQPLVNVLLVGFGGCHEDGLGL